MNSEELYYKLKENHKKVVNEIVTLLIKKLKEMPTKSIPNCIFEIYKDLKITEFIPYDKMITIFHSYVENKTSWDIFRESIYNEINDIEERVEQYLKNK